MKPPVCPYCRLSSRLVAPGQPGYPYRADYGPVYVCTPCDARVGCHKFTANPLGSLANKELREARNAAHKAFDALWKRKMERHRVSQQEARSAGYKWLAAQMGLPEAHMSWMDVAECRRVVEICQPFNARSLS